MCVIKLKRVSSARLDELMYSDSYVAYIMEHAPGDRVVCNGDTLLQAMEEGYLFEDFLDSQGIDPVAYDEEIYSPYYGA